jgi:hypothetical protein
MRHDQIPQPRRRVENVPIWQQASLQQFGNDRAGNSMRLNAARRKVGAGELPRSDELKHVRINLRSQWFNAIPNERIASVFVAVEETDLQRHTFGRMRPRPSAASPSKEAMSARP